MNKNFVVACIAIAAIGFNASAQKKEKAPPPPPRQPQTVIVNENKEYDEFLKRNPTVKSLFWKGTGHLMGVRLKSGKEEVYNLENENEVASAKAKYGNLPEPPPPPPPVPAKQSKAEIPEAPGEPPIPSMEEPAPPAAPGKQGNVLPPKKAETPIAPNPPRSKS